MRQNTLRSAFVFLLVLLPLLAAVACSGEVERRRQVTLERLNVGTGDDENQHVRDQLVTALEKADAASLSQPHLVIVVMRLVTDDSGRGSLGLYWIAARPTATGCRVIFSDGVTADIPFDQVELDDNEKQARELVGFMGNPFVEREFPTVGARLKDGAAARVVLLSNTTVVSNEAAIQRFLHP